MSNLNYKQSTNVERRTWDKETFEARARARAAAEASSSIEHKTAATTREKLLADGIEDLKEEFLPAQEGAAGPEKSERAFLKARRRRLVDEFRSKVGKQEIVTPEDVATSSSKPKDDLSVKDGVTKSSTGVGWHCRVCDCYLKDSLTYLDHINGRRHLRELGFSMRVQKSTAKEVRDKMALLAAEANDEKSTLMMFSKKNDGGEEDDMDHFEDMVRKKDEEALRRKAERARKREERKRKEKEEEEEEEDHEEEGIDPEMAAMMGFSGFGTGKKNR